MLLYFPLQTDIKNNITAAPAAKTNIGHTSEKILCAAFSKNLRSQIFVLGIAYDNMISYNMYRKRDIKFDMLKSRNGARGVQKRGEYGDKDSAHPNLQYFEKVLVL